MQTPDLFNVLDVHGGFTALEASGDTLWRPGSLLKKGSIGKFVSADTRSFYQNHEDVTKAEYRVKGYRLPVLVWFCNRTGRRVDGRSFVAPFVGECDCDKES